MLQYHSDCSCHVKPKGMLVTNHLSIYQAMRLTTPFKHIYCVYDHKQKQVYIEKKNIPMITLQI